MSAVLGIDPGMRKAGYALVSSDGRILARGIERIESLARVLSELAGRHTVEVLAVGSGTNARWLASELDPLGIPIQLVDERETTLRARNLYYAENPARGWQKLLPLGLRFPPRPIDDYAAVLIARRWLARRAGIDGRPS